MHSPDSATNTPKMLGMARPGSEGFNAQPHMGQRQRNAPTQPNGADVEDPARILAMVHMVLGSRLTEEKSYVR